MEYIPGTAKKKLIITDQTSPLEKKSQFDNSRILNIKDNILFNQNL